MISRFVVVVVVLCSIATGEILYSDSDRSIDNDLANDRQQCGMYLVPSTIPGAGRGVVAGTEFHSGTSVEIVPTISVNMRTMNRCQIKNYGFGTGYEDFALIIVGPGNIYNHRKPHSMGRYWAKEEIKDPTNGALPYTDFRNILYRTEEPILPGYEMHETYGDHWFNRIAPSGGRTVSHIPQAAKRMSALDMAQYGHCLTDVRIKNSTDNVGKGLFATKDFQTSEVVTISPVLTLPKRVVDDSAADSVLMNYCFSAPDSELVLFPINYGPMINHAQGEKANVAVDWYDWNPAVQALSAKYHRAGDVEGTMQPLKLADKLAMSVQDLLTADFAQLDIAYRATRTIQPGEELFLDYGAAWQEAWDAYTKKLATAAQAGSLPAPAVPAFRHYLSAPPGLYQKHWATQKPTGCGLFLIPSTIPGAGRGVVAGHDYQAEDYVEDVPTIVVSTPATDNSQLKNYVFGSGHDYFHLIIFGPGNIYNHRKPHTMGRYGRDGDDKDPSFAPYPYTDSVNILYMTTAAIDTGEEMYETYGDKWFKRFAAKAGDKKAAPRGVTEARVAAQRMDTADLLQHGVCLTDTAVHPSTVPGAGRGLFATRDFASGEVVTVAPVLSLPKHVVDESTEFTVLMNYCFTSPDSELALFPINYGPMINHAQGEKANVAVDWYDWSPAVQALSAKYHSNGSDAMQPLKLADKLAMSVQDLFAADFAQLDIAYRATRAIRPGEELFLDYGAAWQEAWDAYAEKIADYVEAQRLLGVAEEEALASRDPKKPAFRQYIAAPLGMYPEHWKVAVARTHDASEL